MNKSLKIENNLADHYLFRYEYEKILVKFKGKNYLVELIFFCNKKVKIVTDKFFFINSKKLVINAFQHMRI